MTYIHDINRSSNLRCGFQIQFCTYRNQQQVKCRKSLSSHCEKGSDAGEIHAGIAYLYIKVRRYVRVADLVLQLKSLAEERITDTAFWRWGSQKILHFSNSKAALANVDKSLFDVSFKEPIIS